MAFVRSSLAAARAALPAFYAASAAPAAVGAMRAFSTASAGSASSAPACAAARYNSIVTVGGGGDFRMWWSSRQTQTRGMSTDSGSGAAGGFAPTRDSAGGATKPDFGDSGARYGLRVTTSAPRTRFSPLFFSLLLLVFKKGNQEMDYWEKKA